MSTTTSALDAVSNRTMYGTLTTQVILGSDSTRTIVTTQQQIVSPDASPLPITECPGPAFVHHMDANGVESYMNILDGSYYDMFLPETTINNAITPSGIRSIGFDAYTRYLYTLYADKANESFYKLGRIGYDPYNSSEFYVDYCDVKNPDGLDIALYGGDVFSPGGVNATEPGYYLAADNGDGYIYIRVPNNFGSDELKTVQMKDLGPEEMTEFDFAFHPDSTDPSNAVFYSLKNMDPAKFQASSSSKLSYNLIRFTADFEKNEIRSVDLGPLDLSSIPLPSSSFVEGVFFEDDGYMYFTTNDPSGYMLYLHVPLDAASTENLKVYFNGSLDTNWTTDGARCVGYHDFNRPENTDSAESITSTESVESITVSNPAESATTPDVPIIVDRDDQYDPIIDVKVADTLKNGRTAQYYPASFIGLMIMMLMIL